MMVTNKKALAAGTSRTEQLYEYAHSCLHTSISKIFHQLCLRVNTIRKMRTGRMTAYNITLRRRSV